MICMMKAEAGPRPFATFLKMRSNAGDKKTKTFALLGEIDGKLPQGHSAGAVAIVWKVKGQDPDGKGRYTYTDSISSRRVDKEDWPVLSKERESDFSNKNSYTRTIGIRYCIDIRGPDNLTAAQVIIDTGKPRVHYKYGSELAETVASIVKVAGHYLFRPKVFNWLVPTDGAYEKGFYDKNYPHDVHGHGGFDEKRKITAEAD